ncbi:hypothetical protein J3455_11900 [Pseudoalteromonas sp. NFXS39]|uniref:hypothetical protein n=1 Tax=Pseudoalteromonas sp. NFXS39 TaxID=2818437 RepID=UPI0032DFC5DC
MLLKYCFLVVILFSSLPVISNELYPSMIDTPKLREVDEKIALELISNKEFMRFISQNYKSENVTLDFDLVKHDISKMFYQCNTSIFSHYPEIEKTVNYLLQESIYGFPRVVEIGHIYNLVKAAREYPTMYGDIDSFFIDMTSPTDEEFNLYKRDFKSMPKLSSKINEERISFFTYIGTKFKTSSFFALVQESLSANELSEFIYYFSINLCGYADQLLAVHGYSHVDGVKVNTWYSARAIASKVSVEARKNILRKYKN